MPHVPVVRIWAFSKLYLMLYASKQLQATMQMMTLYLVPLSLPMMEIQLTTVAFSLINPVLRFV